MKFKRKITSLVLTFTLFAAVFNSVAVSLEPPAAREYATVQDALAILRHIVGLPSIAAVESHNFSGSGEIEVRDALLVLRGLVGLGEPRVVGVRNILPTLPECPDEPLSDAMIERIYNDYIEWFFSEELIQLDRMREHMSNTLQHFTHLGTYNGNVVFIIRGWGSGFWNTQIIAEHVFRFHDDSPIRVWNNGSFYSLGEWYIPCSWGCYVDGERVYDYFGRFETVYGHYPVRTIMPGLYESGLLSQDDIGEIHERFVQWLHRLFPGTANRYYGEEAP
jgi:hypothetical protein